MSTSVEPGVVNNFELNEIVQSNVLRAFGSESLLLTIENVSFDMVYVST